MPLLLYKKKTIITMDKNCNYVSHAASEIDLQKFDYTLKAI